MLPTGSPEPNSAANAATRHFAFVSGMLHRISLQASQSKTLSFTNSTFTSIGLLANTRGDTDQPLNLCLRDQENPSPITQNDKDAENRLLSFGLFPRLSHSSAFPLPFVGNSINGSKYPLCPCPPSTGLAVGGAQLPPALPSSAVAAAGTAVPSSFIEGTAKGLPHSEPLTRHHRRRGWKGLAVCAACHWAFDKMSELNLHYTLQHREILVHELANALLRRQRRQARSSSAKTEARREITSPAAPGSPTSDQPSTTSNSCLSSYKPEAGAKFRENTQADSHASGVKRARKGHMCPRCNYCAKWPTELQKHVVVHATIRPFACMICGNRYKWSWDLGRHFSAVHTSLPNPYKFSRSIKKRRSL
ncbi:hypothetical protein AAHC03_0775 [Spirometra sp. Aus1]